MMKTSGHGILWVPPGHFLTFNCFKGITSRKWYKKSSSNVYAGESFDDVVDNIDVLLSDSTRLRLAGVSNAAISLSGGYDSTLVAYYSSLQSSTNLTCFTKVTTPVSPDSQLAAVTAAKLGLNHVLIDPSDYSIGFDRCIKST